MKGSEKVYFRIVRVEPLDDGEEVGCSLAGAGGSNAQNVAVGNHDGDGLHLNRSGFFVFCGSQNVRGTTKTLDVVEHRLLELSLIGGEGHLVKAGDGVRNVSSHHRNV